MKHKASCIEAGLFECRIRFLTSMQHARRPTQFMGMRGPKLGVWAVLNNGTSEKDLIPVQTQFVKRNNEEERRPSRFQKQVIVHVAA